MLPSEDSFINILNSASRNSKQGKGSRRSLFSLESNLSKCINVSPLSFMLISKVREPHQESQDVSASEPTWTPSQWSKLTIIYNTNPKIMVVLICVGMMGIWPVSLPLFPITWLGWTKFLLIEQLDFSSNLLKKVQDQEQNWWYRRE